ncbi:hypothetical protein I1A62_37415 [Rhodococcus sp. USK10]|uniref:hypothetical protein n=1 Tax=Rhodococcus sp. USK10 TaxID=2789739 RepID=UPI001C5D623C|nr:hypothetical protein [Rhodococcus sp. USK10]QYB02806.1 hypothetical protein I1A62_37415 [Rhodococcus sp. USK10]
MLVKLKSAFWGLLDQGVYSLTSLGLAFFIARNANPDEFGSYGVVFAIATILITIERAQFVMPYMMDFGRSKLSSNMPGPRLRAGAATAVLISGVALASIACLSLVFIGSEYVSLVLAFSFLIPCILLQDVVRYVVLNECGIKRVLSIDVVWAGVQFGLLLWLHAVGDPTVPTQVVVWALSALLSVFCAPRAIWSRWSCSDMRIFISRNGRTGMNLAVESIAASASQYIAILVLSMVGSLTAVGGIRAIQVVLGPLGVFSQGIILSVSTVLIGLGADRKRDVRHYAATISGVVFGISILYIVLVSVIPPHWGRLVLGENWVLGHGLVWPMGIAQAASGVTLGAMLGFRALQISRQTMVVRLALLPVGPAAVIVGYKVADTLGAAVGLMVASIVAALAVWWLFLRSTRLRSEEPVESSVHTGSPGLRDFS